MPDPYAALAHKLATTERDPVMIRTVLVLRGCVEPLASRYAHAAVAAAQAASASDPSDPEAA